MGAAHILTNVAVIFVVVTVWDDLKHRDRLAIKAKIWLAMAVLFSLASTILFVMGTSMPQLTIGFW